MSRIVVMGGAGLMGRYIVRCLADAADVAEIVVADLNYDAGSQVAQTFGRNKTNAIRVDVTDGSTLVNILRGADCVVNAVNYYFNLGVMGACLEAHTHYVDLGGLFRTTRKQIELDDRFRAANLVAILGLG